MKILNEVQAEFEEKYQTLINSYYHKDNLTEQSCRYALQGPGKKVRPMLTLLVCLSLQESYEEAMAAAVAVEMLHTYSLIHDDLPLFDDDDLRRGRPTVHVKYTEQTALLAGDSLLTDLWSFLASNDVHGIRNNIPHSFRLQMILELSQAAGSKGMVLGQQLDWDASQTDHKFMDLAQLKAIHGHKTAKLISASCVLGALAAQAGPHVVREFKELGHDLGMTFQIIDDLLDDQEGTGKSAGKDQAQNKFTYIQLLGKEKAKEAADEYSRNAMGRLELLEKKYGIGDSFQNLKDYIWVLLKRNS